MESSIFFAQLLGPFFIIVAVGVLLNLKQYLTIVEDFVGNAALLYLGGVFALLLGLVIVLFHNVWVTSWTLIITIMGWLSLIKGACLIVCPGMFTKLSDVYKRNTAAMMVNLVIIFALGVILTVMGYFA